MSPKIGQRYGRWTVISRAANRHDKSRWLCQCDCGSEREVYGQELDRGNSKSCRCWANELTSFRTLTHGMKGTPEYTAWQSMISRCKRPTNSRGRYLERGISVCQEWQNNFEAFFAHVGPRPSENHSIDRYPNFDGNYEPGNVRWATLDEQAENKGCRIIVEIKEDTMFLVDWARLNGIPYRTAYDRYRSGSICGYTLAEAKRR